MNIDVVDTHAFQAVEVFPREEMEFRHKRVRELMDKLVPQASGLLVFSKVNTYYLTGTLGAGLFWLPREGQGVLLLRKGMGRARLESPVEWQAAYRSFKEVPGILADMGSSLGKIVAVEMNALPWSMARLLQDKIPDVNYVMGDNVLSRAREVKTEWELTRLREAGRLHETGLRRLLPSLLRPGMTEQEIATECISMFLKLGHGGLARMASFGEEVLFGHVAVGDSGNYPTYYNGPMGFRGIHPAGPCLGSLKIWEAGMPLGVDICSLVGGYSTDKTQMYWAGKPASVPVKAAEAYALSVEAHNRAAAALKPGAIPCEIWQDSLDVMAKTRYYDGYMGLGENKVPFLGHGIGLCIDEQPVFARGFSSPLEQGMVVALEPKIGVPGLGIMGIENTFEITEDGCRNLTGKDTDIIFVE